MSGHDGSLIFKSTKGLEKPFLIADVLKNILRVAEKDKLMCFYHG